jgi:hypothetical protein
MTKAEFYRTSIANCERNLAGPNVRYPNGRMSHEVNAEYLDRMVTECEDYKLESGLFNCDGKLVAFADEMEGA